MGVQSVYAHLILANSAYLSQLLNGTLLCTTLWRALKKSVLKSANAKFG